VTTPTASPELTATSAPTTATPAPTPSTSVEPKPTRPAPALAIHVIGRVSWVEVTRAGGRVLYSGLLRHGREVVVRQGPATAVVGDAGAVRLSRHGRVAGPPAVRARSASSASADGNQPSVAAEPLRSP
jgi:hypothetical protein